MGPWRRRRAVSDGTSEPESPQRRGGVRGWARRLGPLSLLPIAVVVLALAGVGLGREEQSPADVTRPLPLGRLEQTDLGGGIRITLPGYPWTITRDREPLLAYATGGPASIAVWRYPRRERMPRSPSELIRAEQELLDVLEMRDPSFRALASEVIEVADEPAIQIRATQTVLGRTRTVRSTHIYVGDTEIVVDASAPPRDFRTIDRAVFRLVLRSLVLSPGARARRGGDDEG